MNQSNFTDDGFGMTFADHLVNVTFFILIICSLQFACERHKATKLFFSLQIWVQQQSRHLRPPNTVIDVNNFASKTTMVVPNSRNHLNCHVNQGCQRDSPLAVKGQEGFDYKCGRATLLVYCRIVSTTNSYNYLTIWPLSLWNITILIKSFESSNCFLNLS